MVLVLLRLNVLVNIFFRYVGTEPPLPGYYQYYSGSKSGFAQGHNTAEVGIRDSTTRPPRSPHDNGGWLVD